MATGLARAGADIAILDVSKDGADARARSIETLGRSAIGLCCDATSKTSLEQALAGVIERFGHVDILVNAAGVNSGTPFFEITEAEWQRILNIDLTSVFLACQVFGKAMVDAGARRIHHQHLFGFIRTAPLEGIHLRGSKGGC